MRRIRILVVDDSAVVRRIITSVLERHPDIEVVGTAPDGHAAVRAAATLRPDVMTLDVEMPVLDGLSALREMRRQGLTIPTIMFSTLTASGARAAVEALSLGAADVVAKPSGKVDLMATIEEIERELIPRVRALGERPDPRHGATGPAVGTGWRDAGRAEGSAGPTRTGAHPWSERGAARPATRPPALLCIGISTGGPNALDTVIPALPADLAVPVVIVQHMPPMFTTLLAERLDRNSNLKVAEASSGVLAKPGEVWLAPGGRHLAVRGSAHGPVLVLDDGPPENACRPAVDVLFRSACSVYGNQLLTVVMTGLGRDGTAGAALVRDAGGAVIAQDEATSVVWGMPGSVVRAGLADAVVPLQDMAGELISRVGRAASAPSDAVPC